MKVLILILVSLLWFDNLYSQTFGKIYSGVSPDSLYDNPNLIIKNDSIVELTSTPRHMSRQLRMNFSYYKTNDQLIIPIKQLSQTDSNSLIIYKFGQFTNSYSLKLDNNCLIDEKNNIIYVLTNDYGYNKDFILTWIIDGKEYKQNLGTSDGYGLIKRKPKTNRKLQKKLDSIKDIIKEEYDFKIYRGLEAYKKFGFDCIPGVYELIKKK